MINETEGWVQNVPHGDIEAQLTQFQNQLTAHIEQQNPDAAFATNFNTHCPVCIMAKPVVNISA